MTIENFEFLGNFSSIETIIYKLNNIGSGTKFRVGLALQAARCAIAQVKAADLAKPDPMLKLKKQ